MNTKRFCNLAAVFGGIMALPLFSYGQDEEPTEAAAIQVRGRGWKVIANGEQTPSTSAGTDYGSRNTLDGTRTRVFYLP